MNKKDHAILFWGKNNSGYTYNVDNAGLYDHDDITNRFPPSRHNNDAPIEDYIVDSITVKSVIDREVLGNIVINNAKNRKLLNIKLKELLPGDTNWNYRAFSTPEEFLKINKNTINLINQIKKI